MQPVKLKQSDTTPANQQTLLGPDGKAIDLTSANGVTFSMRDRQGTVIVNKATATIVTAADGVVKYDWQSADTSTPGIFYGEWEIDFGSGAIQTAPPDGYQIITITPEVA